MPCEFVIPQSCRLERLAGSEMQSIMKVYFSIHVLRYGEVEASETLYVRLVSSASLVLALDIAQYVLFSVFFVFGPQIAFGAEIYRALLARSAI